MDTHVWQVWVVPGRGVQQSSNRLGKHCSGVATPENGGRSPVAQLTLSTASQHRTVDDIAGEKHEALETLTG